MKYQTVRPSHYPVRVKRGTSGLGLFTESAIPRGKFVVQYWGELLPDAVAQKRGGRYLFELGNGKTVDGATRKNVARYINHSCKPNCVIEFSGNNILVFSKRKIAAGDELTYDYDTEYFEAFIKPHGCRCNSCVTSSCPSSVS